MQSIVRMKLGERVRALRKRLGLTQDKLAEQGGLRRIDVSRVETGASKARSGDIREKLAKAFRLSYDDFSSYLAGELSIEEALGKMGKASLAPMSGEQSTTPRYDRAVALLGDEIAPAVARERRKEATGGKDGTRTVYDWATFLTHAQLTFAEELARRAK